MPETQEFDVIIIGGGINGCGAFRDLCLQGVRCLLLERDDFCAGASGASSRLMHGGLKYIETGEFRLVKEALVERNMLLCTAPHYVKQLECVVPATSIWGGAVAALARAIGFRARMRDRGLVVTRLGLVLYDLFGRAWRAMPRHHMWGRGSLRRLLPAIDTRFIGAGVYHEGQLTHAERLGLELVLDGRKANSNSRAENHVQVLGFAEDVLQYRRADGSTVRARARAIVNAAGAWIDRVNADLGLPTQLMGGSRGSHLVVDNPALLRALNGRMIYFGTPDGRVNLLYPFFGKVLIGATDIVQPDPDDARCSSQEVAYLIAAVAGVFPDIPILDAQIVHRFCGVRPLPRAAGDVGAVTRDHSIVTLALPGSSVPLHCLIGGKWTTFRAFAEQATDKVLADLGLRRHTSTAGLAIGGGQGFPRNDPERIRIIDEIARRGGVPRARAEALLARYGVGALGYCAGLQGRGEQYLTHAPDYAREEILHSVAHEYAKTLDDLILRRTLLGMTGQDGPALRAELADLLGQLQPAS